LWPKLSGCHGRSSRYGGRISPTFPPELVAAVYALGDDIDALKVKQDTLEQSTRDAGIEQLGARLDALQVEVKSLEATS